MAGRPAESCQSGTTGGRGSLMLIDSDGRLTIEITRGQLECWARGPLTDEQEERLDDAVPHSSIPEAIDTIVNESLA